MLLLRSELLLNMQVTAQISYKDNQISAKDTNWASCVYCVNSQLL